MTRINGTIAPKYLSDHHLRAETKEIVRLAKMFKDKMEKGKDWGEIPEDFTLGKGHLIFFMDKGKYIWDRYILLMQECKARRIPYQDHLSDFLIFHMYPDYNYDWEGDEGSEKLVIGRIIDKMMANLRKRPTYGVSFWGKKETPETTIKRLLKSL